MAAHKRVHSGVKQWACDICGKTLSSRDSLSRHKIVFHQEERPHACKECGRTFKIKDTLKKHLKTHGERKYKCEVSESFCNSVIFSYYTYNLEPLYDSSL